MEIITMYTKFNSHTRTLFTAGMLMACNPVQAATMVSDNFDVGIGSWVQNTADTVVVHSASGGNPNGYLATRRSGTIPAIGAQNTAPAYSGNFMDGIWTISVDINFLAGDFNDAKLRYRYQDATFNGWHIVLEDNSFENEWNSYSVTFDTTWDDATAMGHGWVKEDAAVPSFASLWDNVYNSEVRIGLLGDAAAGIDNYKAVGPVPVPAAVWLFGSGLLGLIGIARRKV